ncbi:YfiR family protein [Longitalea luteola]|uniref:YfiR family protein n=1 Tax=Longitalea luteola TaxID=2812563 RepID=UPI001A977780|nr:YfiR family protein [Longitalea luteola]
MKIPAKTNKPYRPPAGKKGKFPARAFAVGLFLLCSSLQGWSQSNYTVHANIIYRFTRYINWPESKRSGEFVIGIVGESPLYQALRSYTSNKTAAGQPIVVSKVPASANNYHCHILFISNEESRNTKRIAAATAGTPTLLVSESRGGAGKGTCINFIEIDDRLKLEINKNNINQRDLEIAVELLSLGTVVK